MNRDMHSNYFKLTCGPPEVCWKCDATKGARDENWSYSNVDGNAPWQQTENDPWSRGQDPNLHYLLPRLPLARMKKDE